MANSMFDEFINVAERIQRLDRYLVKRPDYNYPAMIVLEHKESGENKHAFVGSVENNIRLFDWGISAFAKSLNISFEDAVKAITLFHESSDFVFLNNDSFDINTTDLRKEDK